MCTDLKIHWAVLLVAVSLCLPAAAEMRTWRQKDGTAFRAEYVRQVFSTVVFQDEGRRQIRLPLDSLSQADIDFICSQLAPDFEIRFASDSKLKELPDIYVRAQYLNPSDQTFITTGTATFEKKSRAPFVGKLRAELYLIGQEVATPAYRLCGKSSGVIEFNEENHGVCQLSVSAPIRKYWEYDNQYRGATYAGYVVMVYDPKGNLVKVDSGFPWMTPEKAVLLSKMSVDDFFNEECREMPVPRPKYYTERYRW